MQDRQPKMREFMKYSSFYYTYGFPQKFMVRVESNFIGGRTTLKPHKGSDQNPMRHKRYGYAISSLKGKCHNHELISIHKSQHFHLHNLIRLIKCQSDRAGALQP